jgi:hypothetical protein
MGIKIHLHVFEYGQRKPSKELEKYCEQVYYYKRSSFKFSVKPFIVSSRAHPDLLKNLQSNQYPILFEALHCCYYLDHPSLANRLKLVRMHNIEHHYYQLLLQGEESLFKKIYLKVESLLLSRFEPILHHANYILAISEKDQEELKNRYGNKVKMLPPFHAHDALSIQKALGSFAFYHGKLSVNENHVAAMFLINEVMPHSSKSLVIAGDGAKGSLREAIASSNNITLREGISPAEIDHLIQEAQVNLLPTFQPTGIKLKLVNCLFSGKHILANRAMVASSNLLPIVHLAETGEEMASKLDELMLKPFSEEEIQNRSELVLKHFSNKAGAEVIINLLTHLR